MKQLGRKRQFLNYLNIFILGGISFISGCAEHGFKGNKSSTQLIVTDPTIQQQAEKNPEQEITMQMGNDKIILAKMKFTNPTGQYDETTETITLESDIELDGHKSHAKISGKVINGFAEMYPAEDFDGSLIDFRGTVVCLNISDDGKISCDKAVLDLFAKYKDQYYNEQFELNQVNKSYNFSKADKQLEEKIKNRDTTKGPEVSTSKHGDTTTSSNRDDNQQPTDTTSSNTNGDTPSNTSDSTTTNTNTGNSSDNQNATANNNNATGSNDNSNNQDTDDGSNSDKNEAHVEAEVDKQPGRYVGITFEDIAKFFKRKKSKEDENPVKDMEDKAKEQNRPYNQSFGTPQEGKIANSTPIKEALKEIPNFLQLDTKMQYANYDMAIITKSIAEKVNSLIPNYTLVVRDSSLKVGGENGHESHENGLDIDVGYLHKTPVAGFEKITHMKKLIPNKVYLNETWELFKFILSQPLADRIFVSPALKKEMCAIAKTQSGNYDNILKRLRSDHQNLHENHFHLRLKCPPFNPGCRNFGSDDIPVECD